MAINSVTFSGNIGSDMEVRTTQNNKCIGNFSLPVDQGYGENKKTSWIRCKVLGERAQKLQQYLTKGTEVSITGQFVEETWKHQDGTDRHANVVIVDQLMIGTSPGQRQQNQGQQRQPQQQQQPQQQNQSFQNNHGGFQGQNNQGFGTNAQQPNPQQGGNFNNDEPIF